MGSPEPLSRNALGGGRAPFLPCSLSGVCLYTHTPILPQHTPFLKLRCWASPAHLTGIYWAPAVCQTLCWAPRHSGEKDIGPILRQHLSPGGGRQVSQ